MYVVLLTVAKYICMYVELCSCQVLTMNETKYNDQYGDGFIYHVAKTMCGGAEGDLTEPCLRTTELIHEKHRSVAYQRAMHVKIRVHTCMCKREGHPPEHVPMCG